ncbi:hypothetical protein EMPS_00771 [Entomortierella parvispora]|uniref:Uncharacterized protein n=1 Tax=Entomortierella parvispora TaxID=205924 RepID=A0A9P3LSA7_9FUNG|nr:hypothetical protein EMPS_00771 [Entomortierella parvispora]
MVSSTITLVLVIIAAFLLILFVMANLAKVISASLRSLEQRAQARNGPQKPTTPSGALARAAQEANPRRRFGIPLSALPVTRPTQATASPISTTQENPSTTVHIEEAPVLLVSESEELPAYEARSEVGDCPERVVDLPLESFAEAHPPSYVLPSLEHGQSRTV